MKIKLIKGNILNVKTDSIVLPANTKLREGSGVSTAIFEAAGKKQLTDACRKIGGCEEGSATATLAYNLDSNFIIHAVVPKWEDGQHGEYERLCSAYLAALNVADVMGCGSIAFPLLGSGNNGYDKELALEIALKSFEEFQGENLKTVYLVIYGKRITDIVSRRGLEYVTVPDEYIKQGEIKPRKTADLEKALVKAGKFITDKENQEKILGTVKFVMQIVKIFKPL